MVLDPVVDVVEQQFLLRIRRLQSNLGVLAIGDVARNADQPEGRAAVVGPRKLARQENVDRAAGDRHPFLKHLRPARRHDGAVNGFDGVGHFGRQEVTVTFAEHGADIRPQQVGRSRVDMDEAAFDILDIDGIGRALEDGVEQANPPRIFHRGMDQCGIGVRQIIDGVTQLLDNHRNRRAAGEEQHNSDDIARSHFGDRPRRCREKDDR